MVEVVIEDDGLTAEEFKAEMQRLSADFESLNIESTQLICGISTKLKEMGL